MTMTAVDVAAVPPITHTEGMALFAAELEVTLAFLRGLDEADWGAQTACPAWDVRRMYLHVLGALESGASQRELAHQMLAARRHQKAHGGPLEAGLSHVQVSERDHLSPAVLVERLAAVAPRAVRARTRLPGLLRRFSMKVDGPVVERWTLGYLVDVIYLRDTWMHRVDASRATGREVVLAAAHDGRIVAELVAEWARRHGRPCTLRLTGPAGGMFTAGGGGGGGETIEMDAVDFCRTLAGREPAEGLLATVVPF